MAVLAFRAPQLALVPLQRFRRVPRVKPPTVRVGRSVAPTVESVTKVGLEGAAKTAATVTGLAAPPLLGGLFFGLYGFLAGGLFSAAVYSFSDKGNSDLPPLHTRGAEPPPPPGPTSTTPPPYGPIGTTPIVLPPDSVYVEPVSSIDYSTTCHAHYPSMTFSGWRVVCVASAADVPTSLAFGQQVYTYVQHGKREWDDSAEMSEVLVEAIGPGVANLGDPPGTTAYQLRVVKTTHTNASPELAPIPPGEILVNVPPSFLRLSSTWDEAT